MNLDNLFVDTQIKTAQIKIKDIIISKNFRDICEKNQCGCYNTSHSCPPAVGSLSECEKKISEYNHGIYMQYVGKLEDSFDWEGMQNAKIVFEKQLRVIMQKLRENNVDFLAFGAGKCMLCKKCSYLENKPCRHKDKMILSLEGFGVDVYDLSKNANMPIQNAENKIYVCGLLLIKN